MYRMYKKRDQKGKGTFPFPLPRPELNCGFKYEDTDFKHKRAT